MFHKAQKIIEKKQPYLYVMFPDGVKKYDVTRLYNQIPVFRQLEDSALFDAAYLSPGGYGIIWNDDIDLSVDEIWANGEVCHDGLSLPN